MKSVLYFLYYTLIVITPVVILVLLRTPCIKDICVLLYCFFIAIIIAIKHLTDLFVFIRSRAQRRDSYYD